MSSYKPTDRELLKKAICEIESLKKRVKVLEQQGPPVNPDPTNNKFPYRFPLKLK